MQIRLSETEVKQAIANYMADAHGVSVAAEQIELVTKTRTEGEYEDAHTFTEFSGFAINVDKLKTA